MVAYSTLTIQLVLASPSGLSLRVCMYDIYLAITPRSVDGQEVQAFDLDTDSISSRLRRLHQLSSA